MICFRDRSYCVHSNTRGEGDCTNTECYRYFTKQDSIDANRWWGEEGAPIAWMDCKTEECGYARKEDD